MNRTVCEWVLGMLLIFGSVAWTPAEQALLTLSHNPFSRPAMLAPPVVQTNTRDTPKSSALPELTATLVSTSRPMAIVGGELLGLGEEMDGYRLVAVTEGQAVFIKQGQRHTLQLVGSGVEVK